MLAADIGGRQAPSCSRKIPMICSSVNLDRFIVRFFLRIGLYFQSAPPQNLRTPASQTWTTEAARDSLSALGPESLPMLD
jgi:hypothetical protein